MEIKWLEDFLSVAALGHFSKAADKRLITQSALSRRIKSLELWVGAELLDRSGHPIQLTPAGQRFLESAERILSESYAARAEAQQLVRSDSNSLSIACLHSLALFFVPEIISELRRTEPQIRTSVIAETRTVDQYLAGLASGESDLFISYSHAAFDFRLDRDEFEQLDIGLDYMSPYVRGDVTVDLEGSDPVPFLAFSPTTFMHRVVDTILRRSEIADRLQPVYAATLAESLFTAVREGMGLAWLPESIASSNLAHSDVRKLSEGLSEPMRISVFRSRANQRQIVERVWRNLLNRGLTESEV